MTAPDLATARWRTSSFSGHNGTCVEIANLDCGHHAVRDSKNPTGPTLTVTTAHWAAFTTSIRTSQLD